MTASGLSRSGNVTMHDVARVAGVSIKTVSNVINGYQYLRPETKARVEAAIDELGYQVNVAARNLRQGRTGMIALAVPELRLPYFAELADSVIQAAERSGLRVLIEQTGGRRDREVEILSGSLRHLVDGVIFSPLRLGDDDRELFDVSFPLVLLGESIFDTGVDHVTMSNVQGAAAATAHLVAIGRTRIAAVGSHPGETVGSAALRLQGYRQALEAAGLPYDPALVAPADAWHRSTGEQAVQGLLDAGVAFDAVFAFNDALAHGTLHALHAWQLSVPEQVAVVGFDDIEESAYSTPTLTSIAPGRQDIADRAVQLLVDRAAGVAPSDGAPALVVAPYELHVRQSTTPIVA
ncbi:LacI family DNA-binding transcriptional regulator [uncultured Cellulomonas sp.]|uniref:LacI family DNA-binding transcriptional regulator n=1 Tax=uncultured Cellulomonas sp. TaxID=189682 RepID=UPI002611D51E|nr:LacI family DNA-binding transcriptional regulator [uncultured Cellulomonas sp.]